MKKKSTKLVIFLIVFVDLLGFGIMIPMLPFFARHLNATATEAGALMFVYSLMQFLVSPVWGGLSDRWGRRPILLITILGQSLAFLWAGYSDTYFSLLLSRVFAGIFAANISTASAYMADITKPEERAKGMGLIGAAFGLGFVFGPAIGGILVKHGFEWPSLVAAGITFANFILASLILKEPVTDRNLREENRRRFFLSELKAFLSQPKFFVPIGLFFLLTMAFVQLEIPFGFFVLDRFHFSESEAGYLLAFLGIVMALVQGGLIGRLTKKFAEVRLVLTGIIFIVLGLSTLIFSYSLGVLCVALILLAFGYSLTNPCLAALLSKAAPANKQGSVLGIYQSGASLARIFAPLFAGYLYDQRQELPFVSGVVLVIVAGFILVVRLFVNKSSTSI